jgi:NAD(P)-dependent dehydrogenase (short-subunit alcohol dehydrogenase family)
MLAGKVAVVTGAGRGIGREHALALAKAGASVVVNDLGTTWDGVGERDDQPAQLVVNEIHAAGGKAIADYSDVADWLSAQVMIDRAVATFGRLDVLVCNAGFVRDRMLFNLTQEDWEAVLRVHLTGHMAPTSAAAKYWRGRSKADGQPVNASVVFTTSSSGLYGNAGQTNYDAAKAGIASMAIASARELQRYGVRVNAISPSARTRMTEKTFSEDRREGSDAGFDAMDPANVSPWVVYLCSDDAAQISGQVFEVRGGLVQLVEGWHRVAEIRKDHRWTLDELRACAPSLFALRRSDPPAMPTF